MKYCPRIIVFMFVVFPVIHSLSADEIRPYRDDSPWNQPIGSTPAIDPRSDFYIGLFKTKGVLGMDPYQYTMPVYPVDGDTPLTTVRVTGIFSDVDLEGTALTLKKRTHIRIPMPPAAQPARGRDSQMILWNRITGDEWGFWRIIRTGEGWTAVNGYHYNTNWSGVPPEGFMSRGAGVPYLAGLVRPWEVRQGRIEHALAFAFNWPAEWYVHPATKSDGTGWIELPEGARLQLDPAVTDKEFDQWGLDQVERIICRALQEYGMIVIDKSGHPKLYAEYEATAHWNHLITAETMNKVPCTAFRVLSPPPVFTPETIE